MPRRLKRKMVQKTALEYPNLPSILALIGGGIILFVALLLLTVSVVILPHLNYTTVTPPQGYTGSISGLVSGIVGALASFGLICGLIVLISAIALRLMPRHRQTWGVLILVFSILSFFGFGGAIAGAVLGIVGGILILRWKPPTTPMPQ
jgi:hypothetical protein